MKFLAEQDALIITLEGWELLWGLKRKLIIPRSAIRSLSWQPDYVHHGYLFRLAGTELPGVLYAGYFKANGKRAYLYVHRPRGISWTAEGTVSMPSALVITTEQYFYPLVVVNCNQEIAERLEDWFRST